MCPGVRTRHHQAMTTQGTPADAPPTPPGSAAPTQRQLTRSRDQRVFAGVCGGLARYCGADPVVFRIALAVLVFFGGVGAVIYAACWLFLPEDGDSASPIEALMGRGQSSTSPMTTVILAILGVLAIGVALRGETAMLLALAVLGIVLLARRSPVVPGPPTTAAGQADPAAAPTVPTAYAPYGPFGGGVGGAPAAPPPPPVSMAKPPQPPKPPKPRSPLGRIVGSLTLVVLGLMLAADRLFDVSIPSPVYVAVALGIVGAGLVVGTWYGRSRSLIALGLLLCIALPVASAASGASGLGDQIADRRWEPVAAAAVHPTYDVGFGEGTLDLTRVDFTEHSVSTRADVGFGHLVVIVPSNVDVTVTGSAGAGNINLFGLETNGSDVHRTVTDFGADGAGGGDLKLNVEVGFGALEVVRG